MEDLKPLVTPWRAGKEEDMKAAKQGKFLLREADEETILVKYGGEKWCLIELVHALSLAVDELSQNQCIPSAKCLFEGQQYIDEKYVRSSYDPQDH